MKQKIIDRLKAKFSGINLSNARLDAIADKLAPKITDETTIDAKLDELNEIISFADIAKQDDRVRTLETNQKPKPETPKPEPPAPKHDPKDDDAPEWAKALIDQNKAMALKMEALESGRTAEHNASRLIGILKEKKVPESYYNVAITGRSFKDIAEAETYATQLAEAYGKYNQEQINNGLKDQPQPVMGVVTDPAKDVPPMVKQYLEKEKAERQKLTQKTA